MYTLEAENELGQILQMTDNERYVISSIVGLDPPDSTINTTRNAGDDGSVFNSSSVGNRTITITLAINAPAEENRINLYTYFKAKKGVRLHYTNDTRDVYADGFVQRINIGFFDKKQVAQIVIICPNPFFTATANKVVDFSQVTSNFEFPFDIPSAGIAFSVITPVNNQDLINGGDVDTGFIIKINAIGAVTNPQIYNVETSEFFGLNISLADGDEVTINTKRKQKSVTLLHNGTTSNIIGDLMEGSTWLQLKPADNLFSITASSYPEHMVISCIVSELFEGV